MLEEDFEKTLKVLIVGNGRVGKSSMIRRFCTGVFTQVYKRIIGVDFLEKVQYCRELGEDVRLMLWDTAGQEEYDTITRTYYRGAGACVLAFSTTDLASFRSVATWKKKVEAECGEIAMVLVQTKVDLIEQAVVDKDEAEALAEQLGLKFYRTSVKDNLNVDLVFEDLVSLAEQYASTSEQQQQQQRLASASASASGSASPSPSQTQPQSKASTGQDKGKSVGGGQRIGANSSDRNSETKTLCDETTSPVKRRSIFK